MKKSFEDARRLYHDRRGDRRGGILLAGRLGILTASVDEEPGEETREASSSAVSMLRRRLMRH